MIMESGRVGRAEFGAGGAGVHGFCGVGGAGYAGRETAEDHAPGPLHEHGLGRRVDQGVAANLGASPADTLANFESVVTSVKHPPGPTQTWLGETIVHGEDIRRALGIQHKYPAEAVVTVADFYKGSNLLIGSKNRIDGLTLRATDADWSHGTGPEVSGPILSLVMAMTGRKAADDDLTGDGVATLRSRS